MKTRRWMAIVAVVCVGLGAWAAEAPDASRRALAEELLNLMNMRENLEKALTMARQILPAQMEQMGKAAGRTNQQAAAAAQMQKNMDMMAKELNWDNLKDDYISLYAETFTEEELKGIIAFYKSPPGQAFIKKQPEVMKRSMQLSQKLVQQLMPRIQAMAAEAAAGAASDAAAAKVSAAVSPAPEKAVQVPTPAATKP